MLKRTVMKILRSNPVKSFSILVLFVVTGMFALSCAGGQSGQSSENPFGGGIIAIFLNDSNGLFGNGCEEGEIEVQVEKFPDGSGADFRITGRSLPTALSGCILEEGTVIINKEVFASYLSGINVQPGSLLAGDPDDLVEAVNVAVDITTPDGDEESDFVAILLKAIGIIAPDDVSITVPFEPDAPTTIFVRLTFRTVGIKPGTQVEFTLLNDGLGTLDILDSFVSGSIEDGSITVQYTAFTGAAGAQEVCARIRINYPAEHVPPCPSIPDEIIEECVNIDQSVDPPMPTPGPTPTPPPAVEICSNGVDDDGDTLIDCFDPDCTTNAACETGALECTNGVDDDADGPIDCADAGCEANPSCEFPETTCDDGFDNDGDGGADCADPNNCVDGTPCNGSGGLCMGAVCI